MHKKINISKAEIEEAYEKQLLLLWHPNDYNYQEDLWCEPVYITRLFNNCLDQKCVEFKKLWEKKSITYTETLTKFRHCILADPELDTAFSSSIFYNVDDYHYYYDYWDKLCVIGD